MWTRWCAARAVAAAGAGAARAAGPAHVSASVSAHARVCGGARVFSSWTSHASLAAPPLPTSSPFYRVLGDNYGVDPTSSSSSFSSSSSSSSSSSTSSAPPPPLSAYRDPRMLDCILVRHGESEGNVAYNRSWEGDHSLYSGAFLKRHSSLWRLTDRGREQAALAGKWLRENMPEPFAHRYYVSEYIRAMETAGLLDLQNAHWFVEVQLRERDWGAFDILSQKERVVRFAEETRRRDRDSLFYAPPGGESLVHVLSRVDGVLNSFNRHCANRRCIAVCHGEVMWAFRLRFERLSQLTYREMELELSPHERIHNAQILWYSRRNPHTGEISPIFKWKRSVCPWDLSRSRNVWEEVVRVDHTNESLLTHVQRVKRIYAHDKSHREMMLLQQQQQQQQRAQSSPQAQAQSAQASLAQQPTGPSQQAVLRPSSPAVASTTMSSQMSSPTSPTSPLLALSSKSLYAQIPLRHDLLTPLAAQPPSQQQQQPPQPQQPSHPPSHSSAPPAVPSIAPAAPTDPPAGMREYPFLPFATRMELKPTDTRIPPQPVPNFQNPFELAHPRVLVLTKTPRYEHEQQSLGLKGNELHKELSKIGFVSDRLIQSYVRHMEGLAQLTLALQQHGMRATVKHVDACRADDLNDVDLVISAGGDGTLLKAASWIGQPAGSVPNSEPHQRIVPLLGVNTDPQHSAGVLCSFSIEGPHTADRVLDHIRKGHIIWRPSSRIHVKLVSKDGTERIVPHLALNEVLIAEADPGRPIIYEMMPDDHPPEMQRSSGVLVSTGTGSTAWMTNAAGIHPETVARVLRDVGVKHTTNDTRHIADRLNMELVFEPSSQELEYYVREGLQTGFISARSKTSYHHGWTRRLQVRSLGWDTRIILDGLLSLPLEKGTSAILSVGQERAAPLYVLSLTGTGGEAFSRQ